MTSSQRHFCYNVYNCQCQSVSISILQGTMCTHVSRCEQFYYDCMQHSILYRNYSPYETAEISQSYIRIQNETVLRHTVHDFVYHAADESISSILPQTTLIACSKFFVVVYYNSEMNISFGRQA